MITKNSKVSPDANVVFTEMENGESVLLHLGTSQYFSLNQTGTLIWQYIEKGLSLSEIGREIEGRFDVTADKAIQSVINLVGELTAERLLEVVSD